MQKRKATAESQLVKTFYFLPILMALFSLTPVTIHRDDINMTTKSDPTRSIATSTLTPSHWQRINYDPTADDGYNASQILKAHNGKLQIIKDDKPQASTTNTDVSSGAKFQGFPFAAYFKDSFKETNADGDDVIETVEGFSWLWGLTDIVLVLTLFALIFIIDRRVSQIKKTVNIEDSYEKYAQISKQSFVHTSYWGDDIDTTPKPKASDSETK